MANTLRFLFYGALSFFVLISKGHAIRICFEVLKNDCYYMEDTRFLIVNTIVLALMLVYMIWLVGATFDHWRMHVVSHMIPFAVVILILVENGWLFRTTSSAPGAYQVPREVMTPVDRAMNAMSSLKTYLKTHPCSEATASSLLEGLGAQRRISGYRRHGATLDWNIIIKQGVDAPIVNLDMGDTVSPGTIVISCNGFEGQFGISALISSAIPTGQAVFVVDGVGRPATFTGMLEK